MDEELAQVLELLYVTDETFTADEIAASTDMDGSEVEQALSVLEENGFVQIGIKVDSREFHDISITSHGARMLEEYRPTPDRSGMEFEPTQAYWASQGRA